MTETHEHLYELCWKDRYVAIFFCECGAAKSAPVDERGKVRIWGKTSALEPRLEDADGPHRGSK